MQQNPNRVVSFYVSENLKKALQLPHVKQWRVHDGDVVISGSILCYTKAKGMMFNHMSNLRIRPLTLTRHGFLIIYDQEDKGFVLDVRAAKKMSTKTDNFKLKHQSYRRCRMKLKFKFGTVYLFLLNNEIPGWRTAISTAHDNMLIDTRRKYEQETQIESGDLHPSLSNASIATCILMTNDDDENEIAVEMPDKGIILMGKPVTGRKFAVETSVSPMQSLKYTTPVEKTNFVDSFDPTVCDSSYQWLHTGIKEKSNFQLFDEDSSNSGLITDLSDNEVNKTESVKSIRCGYMSVATLRRRLEAKMRDTVGRRTGKNPLNKINITPMANFAPPLPINRCSHRYTAACHSTSSMIPEGPTSSPPSLTFLEACSSTELSSGSSVSKTRTTVLSVPKNIEPQRMHGKYIQNNTPSVGTKTSINVNDHSCRRWTMSSRV